MTCSKYWIIWPIAAVLLMDACSQQNNEVQIPKATVSNESVSMLETLIKLAQGGDAKSQLELSKKYSTGHETDKNDTIAFVWLLKSAEGGNAEAMFLLSNAYRGGIGIPKDKEQSLYWVKRSAESGNADAQVKHAGCFGSSDFESISINGPVETKKEYARQYVEWLDKAATQNHNEAQYNLGMVYVLGAFSKPTGNKLIETSIDEGLSLLKLSADAGYWKAQLALADIYQSGSGKVKPDKVLSEKYFQLLSEQNNPEVIYQIACHYDLVGISIKLFGENTHRGRRLDYEETNRIALEWYLKAAIKGHTESASSAGEFYLDGRGGVKDKQMAVRYFKQAAENGDFTSMLKLALAYLNGEGVTKDYAEAKKWFDKVAVINKGALFHDQELLKVWHILGTLYELGLGTDRDLILAYAWYNITAAEGFNGSKKDLARVERIISPDELREAQVLSREWKPGRLLIRGSNQPSSSGVVDGKSPASNASGKTLKLARVGTGFFISSNGNVLTSNHVVDGCVEIRFPADNSIGKAVLADTANDIAFVKTDVVGKPILYFPSGDDLKQGAEIFAFGYPLDGYLPNAGNITTGIVSALAGPGNNSSYIQITAPVQPGNSGGPLLNKKGKVVGIVVGKADAIKIAKVTGDIPQNVNFAIALRTIKSFLDGNGVEYQKKGDVFALDKDTVEIAGDSRKSTIKIECWR